LRQDALPSRLAEEALSWHWCSHHMQ
jgi:hypothetical protein